MPVQTLKRWGNSLAVRIPANIASEVEFSEGQEVDVQVEDGQVLVRPYSAIRRFSRERYRQQLRDATLDQATDGELAAARYAVRAFLNL